jgi:3-methyl-2-oxobutanoate hydroxymethyltransferase
LTDARSIAEAGAFALVLEKIPATLAKKITAAIDIPTIGIGAGVHCSGQILVTPDVLGLYEDFHPRFVRKYAKLADDVRKSVGAYVKDVKDLGFPGPGESY